VKFIVIDNTVVAHIEIYIRFKLLLDTYSDDYNDRDLFPPPLFNYPVHKDTTFTRCYQIQ